MKQSIIMFFLDYAAVWSLASSFCSVMNLVTRTDPVEGTEVLLSKWILHAIEPIGNQTCSTYSILGCRNINFIKVVSGR